MTQVCSCSMYSWNLLLGEERGVRGLGSIPPPCLQLLLTFSCSWQSWACPCSVSCAQKAISIAPVHFTQPRLKIRRENSSCWSAQFAFSYSPVIENCHSAGKWQREQEQEQAGVCHTASGGFVTRLGWTFPPLGSDSLAAIYQPLGELLPLFCYWNTLEVVVIVYTFSCSRAKAGEGGR